MTYEAPLFLGFDLSTQQLKIIVTDEGLHALKTYHVEFDKEYSAYGIHKGVIADDKTGKIVSPIKMWLEAIDHVFAAMKRDNFPFDKVRGLSGSGMQHGSIFWAEEAHGKLKNMAGADSLLQALDGALAWEMSPNWQDHLTGKEIEAFETVAGGPDAMAERTGSRAHYRFTGLQIRKLAVRSAPEVYKKTDHILLVSSFLATVLLGAFTPVEEADACGMNIYNIEQGCYDEELLAVAAGVHGKLDGCSESETEAGVEELRRKLGTPTPVSYESLGLISPYFVEKYGFSPETAVYSFTGDNLATIIALPLQQNDILILLGTSTTVLLVTEHYAASLQYHLFKHPTLRQAYMGMICYCNGALARENVRNELNEKIGAPAESWDRFDEILDATDRFDNRLGIYFPLGEIVPNASAQFRRCELQDGKVVDVDEWDVENDVSSIVESQTISCRLRAGPMLSRAGNSAATPEAHDAQLDELYGALKEQFGDIVTDGKRQTYGSLTSRPHKIYYVGGASRNTSIIRKMGSILGATDGNYQVEIPNACAMGGAFKASWSYACGQKGEWIDYNKYLLERFDDQDVDQFQVRDEWANYFPALGVLATMEQKLKHD